MNEAEVRTVIDSLLKKAGWRLPGVPSLNVGMEQRVVSASQNLAADYVLRDDKNFPLAVLEAKKSDTDPRAGKEQARKYAEKLKARFVILSNGAQHYFWDLQEGSPEIVPHIPSLASLTRRRGLARDRRNFADEKIGADYIALTQGADTPPEQVRKLRDYQQEAVQAVQNAAAQGRQRFLLQMATGTGKTLISAAIIKMYLRSGNARRVLFLVDRLELEEQAQKNMRDYLSNDCESLIYKEHPNDWNRAQIVISTVQSLAYEDRYRDKFSPLDFDLLVVDEAHRAICGKGARGVFEYFIAHKVGLTATPRDYFRGVSEEELKGKNPKEYEARLLRDTCTTFGGEPVFCYDLARGVKDDVLLSPTLIDARTEITTKLLSEEGAALSVIDKDGDIENIKFTRTDYERKLFSPATARVQCRAFLEHARRDPISDEIGKSIVYCVSQNHAAKTAQILNELADDMYPGRYSSDFAMQVTSNVPGAKEYTRNFVHNNLSGQGNFLAGYRTGKTRVCVTVGMMTTGYDCPDLLNLCILRPIFSPSEFVQIKGRGTRRHSFKYRGEDGNEHEVDKDGFSLFDFFAVCEYFEEEHDYDEKLSLPQPSDSTDEDFGGEPPKPKGQHIYEGADKMRPIATTEIPTTRADIELSRAELLDQETAKYLAAIKPEPEHLMSAIKLFGAYIGSPKVREIIDNKEYAALSTSPELTDDEFRRVPQDLRDKTVRYAQDYVDWDKLDAA